MFFYLLLLMSIYIILSGGLGNKMFQIASAYGIAKSQNKEYYVKDGIRAHTTQNYFTNIFRRVKYTNRFNKYLVFNEPNNSALLKLDIPNLKNTSTLLGGYFQNEKYFKNCRMDILELFQIEKERKIKLNSLYPDIKNYYFIHIRRGDYVNTFHDIDLNSYYPKAIEYIKNKDSEAKFIIFSNDINSCKNLSYLKDCIFIQNKDELDDFYLMTMCYKGGIACNSTFSWWGGYLNTNENKIIIFPNKWFLNDWIVEIGWEGSILLEV